MTGTWLLKNKEAFNWLVQQHDEKRLDITWIPHSFSHIYLHCNPAVDNYCDDEEAWLARNFMLHPSTNVKLEILRIEILLLERGQIPSVFFRFPGLVSDEGLVFTLTQQFGLIPLGADAWLAKYPNRELSDGSIILVHGNGNEPRGIELLMPYLLDRSNKWLSIADVVPQ